MLKPLYTVLATQMAVANAFPRPIVRESQFPRSSVSELRERQDMFGNWTQVSCTDYGVTDAAMPSNQRWTALDANGAWSEVTNAWNNDPAPDGDLTLQFPEWLMNYFHGPDNWNCQDINNGGCSPGVLQCGDTTHPAGWLIMNSFANIHDTHKEIYNALTTATAQMQAQIGAFTSTFDPIKENNDLEVLKDILDAAAFVIGSCSAYFWNKIADTVLKVWKDSGNKGFSKDIFNAAVAFTINANKDNLSAASASINEQNSLSSAMGLYFQAWQKSQADFINFIFDGSAQSLPQLGGLVADGAMNWPQQDGPDFQDFVEQAQQLVYAQLIPMAWQHGQSARIPVVIESTDPCSSKAGPQLKNYMSDGTAAATHMCMNDKIYYLVDAKPPSDDPLSCISKPNLCEHKNLFNPLPGGSFDNLHGNWGNVRVDDIVIASYQGWVNNGNKNGWTVPDFASAISGGASPFDLFANGIRTPGYNNIPFCSSDNFDDIITRILNGGSRGPYWPCE
ncbi:hypothetical protein BGZ63DRAFT_425168 [Mariannaea sp. PMI_226]|nr:hypothetical protein BGZ63DRAFT_425168 [Mariannaea sp. PMI_226]